MTRVPTIWNMQLFVFAQHHTYVSRLTRKIIVEYALIIDLDQPRHTAQASPDRHFSPTVDFLFKESSLYTSIPLRRNVSARTAQADLGRYITQTP